MPKLLAKVGANSHFILWNATLSRFNAKFLKLLGTPAETGQLVNDPFRPREIIKAVEGQSIISRDRAKNLIEMTYTQFGQSAGTTNEVTQKRVYTCEAAQDGLRKLVDDGDEAKLTKSEVVALEAIVIVEGARPSLRLQDGKLDCSQARLGPWKSVTADNAQTIESISRSVGKINLDSQQIGTGFVVGDGLVMTNRHVLQNIASKEAGTWYFKGGAQIDFGDSGNPNEIFELCADGIFASEAAIDLLEADFSKYDVAVLQCKGSSRSELPPPLKLEDTRSDVVKNRCIYTLGYPGKPQPGSERFSLLKEIFDFEFGVKRYSPGEIEIPLGEVIGDQPKTVFGHDCTTLGGNSGSPIIDLGDSNSTVVGIHFSGSKRVSNFGHSLAALRNEFDGLDLEYI